MEVIIRNEGKYPARAPVELFDEYAKNNNQERGMSLVNGPEWHRVRSATQQHLLKPHSAAVYVGAQAAVANDLITRMSKITYTPEEFRNELFQYATESIGVVAFNKRLGFMAPDGSSLSTENANYITAIQTFFALFYEDIGLSLYKVYPTKLYRRFEKVAKEAYGYGRAHIREAMARFDREIRKGTFDPEEPNLILQLQAHPNMKEGSVEAIMLDLLTAGTDSTAKNVEFLLLSLALNPSKQQTLYEEIVDVIGPKGSPILADHMTKMAYYRSCMKESFRLNFPLPFGTLRVLPKDVMIGDYLVPKGTVVVCNNRRLLLNSEYFESPSEFLPERWLRYGTNKKRDKDYPGVALLPFGFGLRKCIGRRFAEQELWLAVTKILQNFKVTVSQEDRNYEIIYTTFGQVKKPINFTFKPR
ncbi:probable cytochrome P450 49a1 [Haliotis rufescens]|uniref:probable cytochrome P450 49a1 n=1 Tax=Haliotis rufescens TaxID=6454 RepID=UPI00201F22F8|nr:probable cytochrome P450 49a1 [Haliotis rufescens]